MHQGVLFSVFFFSCYLAMAAVEDDLKALAREELLAQWKPLSEELGVCLGLIETCPIEQRSAVLQSFEAVVDLHAVMGPLKIMIKVLQRPSEQASINIVQVMKSVKHAWEGRAVRTEFDEEVMNKLLSGLASWKEDQRGAMDLATPSVVLDFRKHLMEIVGGPEEGFPFAVVQVRLAFHQDLVDCTKDIQMAGCLKSFIVEILKFGMAVKQRSKLEALLELMWAVKQDGGDEAGDQSQVSQWLASFDDTGAGHCTGSSGASSSTAGAVSGGMPGRHQTGKTGGRATSDYVVRPHPYGGVSSHVKVRLHGVAGATAFQIKELVTQHIGEPQGFEKRKSWSYVDVFVRRGDWHHWTKGAKRWTVWQGPREVTMVLF